MTKTEESELKETETISFDLKKMYEFEPKDAIPDITVSRYSNLAYIQVSQRDVYIDFLEMPGIKKEGKVLVNGTRIYMSFAAAQKLSKALGQILERVHSRDEMERYDGKSDSKQK